MSKPTQDLAAGSGTWVSWNPATPFEDVPVEESIRLIHRLFEDEHVRTIDTANNYGFGASERRIGQAIREYGGIPDGFLVQTKADRDMTTGDFTGERMLRSLDESRERLGLDVLPAVYLHDAENTSFDEAMADGGPVAVLVEQQRQGGIGVLGLAGGPVGLMGRYLATGCFDAVITHNRYTLVDRSAEPLIAAAYARGAQVTNASPYGGGFLTAWPPPSERYAYDVAGPGLRASAAAIAAVCEAHGVPLAVAALHFSLRDERIGRTIIGMRTVSDLDATSALLAAAVPDELWTEIDAVTLHPEDWQDPPFVGEDVA